MGYQNKSPLTRWNFEFKTLTAYILYSGVEVLTFISKRIEREFSWKAGTRSCTRYALRGIYRYYTLWRNVRVNGDVYTLERRFYKKMEVCYANFF